MSLFRSLLRWLRGSRGDDAPPPPAAAVPSDLRARVEEVLESDDGDRLVTLLRDHQPAGKELIREYAREMEQAGDADARMRLVRRITALVAVYDRAFEDREPLRWFQQPDDARRDSASEAKLRAAQAAFGRGEFDVADVEAEAGLDLLHADPDTPRIRELVSTLLAVRGAIATRRDRWDDARDLFVRSLDAARACEREDTRAAALLNLLDLYTRREKHEEAAELIEDACAAAAGTSYDDVLAKILVERGVALTRAGRLAEAVGTLDRAVHTKPDWPFPLYQRGWARFLSGDSSGALEDYRRCAQKKRVFFTVQREIRCLEDVAAGRLPIETYRSFCVLREQVQQRPAEVETSATIMTERHPEFAPAYLLRAEARLALQDLDAARAAARETMQCDPDPDTAAAALFFDWNLSRLSGDADGVKDAAARLAGAYRDHPAAMIVEKVGEVPKQNLALRWTFAMDGSLHFEEIDPGDVIPPDRTPPPPGSPG